MAMNYHGQRITVMGLGHFGGGVAAARWLAQHGAMVTVTDLADQTALADSLAELADVPIAGYHLGGHQEDDFRHAETVVVNPAVRPSNPLLEIARQSGAHLTTEIGLLLAACPATVIGVTGSNGKSTTAAMTAAIFQAAGMPTWLGGNIGGSLLGRLDEMTADERVVLELSSFQLWHLRSDRESKPWPIPMPHIAVVTGCSPNHLDWHPTISHYIAAKQLLLAGQTADDLAVLNTFDPLVASWGRCVQGRQVALPPLDAIPPLRIPGRHNRINAACAAAAAMAGGCSPEAIQKGLQSFGGLPQRLELFAVIEGRRFYNDSTSTTPESTIAAIESLDEPIWLIAGGRDKGFDFSHLVEAIANHTKGAAFFGSVAPSLQTQTASRRSNLPCAAVETMAEALQWCWRHSQAGDAIVLSPACSSHDQFRNFRERGERFTAMVSELVARPKASGTCFRTTSNP